MPADCQLDSAQQQHNRTAAPLISADSASMSLSNNCSGLNDSRHHPHHQLINHEQEPPDGDETDPDVIPNQYGE